MTIVAAAPSTNGHKQNGQAKKKPRATSRSLKSSLAQQQVKEPKNIPELVEKVENDPKAKICKSAILTACDSAEIDFVCDPPNPKFKADAEAFRELWQASKKDFFPSFAYGRCAFFKRWVGGQPIRALEFLPFEMTYYIVDKETGKFGGIGYRGETEDGKDDQYIAPIDALWLAIDATPLNPHGRSRYIGAVLETWKKRQKFDITNENYDNKQSTGNRVLKAPCAWPKDNGNAVLDKGTQGEIGSDGELQTPLDDAMDRVAVLEGGGTVGFHSGQHPADQGGGELYSLTNLDTVGDSAHLQSRQKKYDDDMPEAFGFPPQALSVTETGAYAMVSAFQRILYYVAEEFLRQIVAAFQKYVINNWIDFNYPEGQRPKITMVLKPLYSETKALLTEVAKQVLTGPDISPLVLFGAVNGSELFKTAGIPTSEKFEQLMALILKDRASQAAQQQPSFIGGNQSRFAMSAPKQKELTNQTVIQESGTVWANELTTKLKDILKDRPGDEQALQELL